MVGQASGFHFIHEIVEQQAGLRPGGICVYPENGAPITYGELWHSVQQTRGWLEEQGVRCGSKVMIIGENCPEMIVLLFACSLLQAWPVSVNARLSAREIAAICEHADPALLFFTSGISDNAAAHARSWDARPCPDGLFRTSSDFLIRRSAGSLDDTHAAAAVAALIYTSGTTGAPKGVMVSHRGLLHFAGISAASRRMTADDIAYAALPLSHIFGLATVLMSSFSAGASLVLRARFDVQDVVAALRTPGISVLQGVPTMFVRLLSTLEGRSVDAPRLRYIYVGGAAMDMALKARAEAFFDLPLHHGYGITEYAGSMFVTDIDHPRSDAGVGQALAGVEIDIRREGRSLPRGESGGIYIRGPGVTPGYYKDPARTAQALLPGGWLDTGDVGYLDEAGVLFITGRDKDIIIRSGFNVYPQEVEAVINAFPGVRLSAVVGVPEADGNECVVAYYETEEGRSVDVDALAAYVAAAVAPYKRPASYVARESIPTTLSGKIQKQTLREHARGERAAQAGLSQN